MLPLPRLAGRAGPNPTPTPIPNPIPTPTPTPTPNQVPLTHVTSEGHDHFTLPATATADRCAAGALTAAGEYSVCAASV